MKERSNQPPATINPPHPDTPVSLLQGIAAEAWLRLQILTQAVAAAPMTASGKSAATIVDFASQFERYIRNGPPGSE